MAALIILLFFLSGAASDLHLQTAHPGENATLKCDAGNASIKVVEWTRDDLKSMDVLLYRGRPITIRQHPSFKGRVELVNRKIENGDASIILKNVRREDSGTYRCRVVTAGSSRTKRGIDRDPIKTIQLEVTDSQKGDPMTDDPKTDDPKTDDPGNEDFTRGYVGLGAAAGVGGVVMCFVIVGLFLVRKYKKHPDNRSERSAADEAAVHQLM